MAGVDERLILIPRPAQVVVDQLVEQVESRVVVAIEDGIDGPVVDLLKLRVGAGGQLHRWVDGDAERADRCDRDWVEKNSFTTKPRSARRRK